MIVQSPGRFGSIHHVAIAVVDIEQTVALFEERYGLRQVHSEIAEEPGVRLAYLDGGAVYVQLVQPIREGAVQTFLEERGEGLHHVCFEVPDIYATARELNAAGESSVFLGGQGRLACFLEDTPAGALIELVEAAPSGATADGPGAARAGAARGATFLD